MVRALGFLFLAMPLWAHDLDGVLKSYQDVQLGLAKDVFTDVIKGATALKGESRLFLDKTSKEDTRRPLIEKIAVAAEKMAQIPLVDVKGMRNQIAAICDPLIVIMKKDAELKSQWDLCYCPMVKKYWVQSKKEAGLMNPYMGTEMQECGTRKRWP